jgi:hypothetical protein
MPTLLITIYVGFDLPIRFLKVSGANLPYKEEIFLGLGLIILIINIRRTIRRWMGIRIVNRKERFKWNTAMSAERKSRVRTYLILEVIVFGSVATGLYVITPEAWMPAVGFMFAVIDNIIFAIYGGSNDRYRMGLSSKAIIAADRDVNVVYFNGLRKVTIHQDSIYFDYIKGLQLDFPVNCIPAEQMDEFFSELEQLINKDKVFVSRG